MARFTTFLTGLAAVGGWRAVLLQMLCGALVVLALPPVHFLPALVGYAGLFLRLHHCRCFRSSFAAGWAFAFGYHVAGLYWISNALLVHGDRHAWMVPFAAAGLPAFLGIFGGLAGWLGWRYGGKGPLWLFAMVALWGLFEWSRGVVLTGFPWNLAAYVWADQIEMMQSAAWIGSYGLALVTVLLGASPVLLMVPGSGGGWTFGNWTPGRIGFALVVLLTAGLWAGGAVRLSGEPTGASVEGVVLRLVQGNVAQKDKWRPELGPAHMREYLKMSTARDATVRSDGLAANRKPSHVIWPETSIPYFLNEQPQLVRDLSVAAPVGGTLIAGAPRIERGERLRLYNSLYAIAAGAGIVATYDKAHLVPFGEYVPFKEFLPLLPVVETFQGFDPGPGPRTLKLPGLPAISPLICYEVVFPGEVAVRDAAVSPMPRFLLNLTNDAWYGHSSGPYQHFAIARFRAVEEGLPMVRVANNGISGVVDAHGRVIAMLGMEVKGTIDSILPPSLSELTLFAKFGIQPFFLITFVLLLISYISRHPRI